MIPHDRTLDSTIAFARNPYRFVDNRCVKHQSNIFQTRLLFQKTICLRGREAARIFYDPDLTTRRGAAPGRLQKTLFGQGGVQGLDGPEHEHRKAVFVDLMTPARVGHLADLVAGHWRACGARWESEDHLVLYHALQEVLTRAACEWVGVPLPESDVARRTHEISALFDAAGTFGPRHWYARAARKRADRWMEGTVADVRSGTLPSEENSPLSIVANHRDPSGALLDPQVAAVELMNLIRPTVAVAVYIVFCAHALHEYPQYREPLAANDDGFEECFVDEVRRFYPFFPAVVALAAQGFEWNGYRVPKGRRILLDLYSTNHEVETWGDPEAFRPERFREQEVTPFNMIPQGGGDYRTNHRCPGEPVARELMKTAARMLTRHMSYDVPRQDLAIDFSRLPALPYSKFLIRKVRFND